MNGHLSPQDRYRLARLLGMTGSAHDGEALNAARLADRLVRDRGVTWIDAIAPGGDVATCSAPTASSTRRSSSRSEPQSWRGMAASCSRYPLLLDKWEAEFLNGLGRFPYLSAKQQTKLVAIASRLLAAGCEL